MVVTFFAKTIFRVGTYKVSLFNLVFILWTFVSMILFLNFTIRYFKFSKKFKNIPIIKDEQAQRIMSKICDEKFDQEKITIIKSDAIQNPCTIGVFTPTIFLPNISLKDSELRLILLHEWTHFKNRDSFIKILIQILCCIFWWNPLMYLFFRELDQILEIRCDQKVTEGFSKEQIKEYLNTLLFIIQKNAENSTKKQTLLSGENYFISEQNGNMKQRFELIMQRKTSKVNLVIMTIFMILNIASFFVIVQPSFEYPSSLTAPNTQTSELVFDMEDAYIVYISGDEYQLFSNGQYITTIPEELAIAFKEEGFQIYQ